MPPKWVAIAAPETRQAAIYVGLNRSGAGRVLFGGTEEPGLADGFAAARGRSALSRNPRHHEEARRHARALLARAGRLIGPHEPHRNIASVPLRRGVQLLTGGSLREARMFGRVRGTPLKLGRRQQVF